MIKQFIEDRPWVWMLLHPITAFRLWRISKKLQRWTEEHAANIADPVSFDRIASMVDQDIIVSVNHETGVITFDHRV